MVSLGAPGTNDAYAFGGASARNWNMFCKVRVTSCNRSHKYSVGVNVAVFPSKRQPVEAISWVELLRCTGAFFGALLFCLCS